MINNILIKQKAERDYLLRQRYLLRIEENISQKFLSSNLIKLISGPRRAGKSVMALQLLREKNFAYLNFDDDLLLKYFDEERIFGVLHDIYPEFEFLLLDEIQNLPDWELWIAKLYRRGYHLVITGSNAKLLSHEMATALTGRYIQIPVFPFSFTEFIRYNRISGNVENSYHSEIPAYSSGLMNRYLNNGGFPETTLNQDIAINYLNSLFDSVLLKDIIRRFKIRKTQFLYDLANYLLANYTNPFSLNQLSKELNFNSVTTLQKYLAYLEESYLFINLTRYSHKIKNHQKSNKKSYIIDNGFIRARSFEISPNIGRLFENMIFGQLLRKGYKPGLSLFYYRTRNDKEVDFVLRSGHIIEKLVQVCYDTENVKTMKRETEALWEASGELSCRNLLIITWDKEGMVEKGAFPVKLVPAQVFLSEE